MIRLHFKICCEYWISYSLSFANIFFESSDAKVDKDEVKNTGNAVITFFSLSFFFWWRIISYYDF